MKVTAQLNGLRMAPRKVRAVVNVVKKQDAMGAINQLNHMARRPAPQLLKLLNSAIANAENTYQMVRENLYIKELFVDEGIKLKRFMPRAQGRATEIQKKTSVVKLVLEEKVPGMKREKTKDEPKEKESIAEKQESKSTEDKKPEIKRDSSKPSKFRQNIAKRLPFLRRKAI